MVLIYQKQYKSYPIYDVKKLVSCSHSIWEISLRKIRNFTYKAVIELVTEKQTMRESY